MKNLEKLTSATRNFRTTLLLIAISIFGPRAARRLPSPVSTLDATQKSPLQKENPKLKMQRATSSDMAQTSSNRRGSTSHYSQERADQAIPRRYCASTIPGTDSLLRDRAPDGRRTRGLCRCLLCLRKNPRCRCAQETSRATKIRSSTWCHTIVAATIPARSTRKRKTNKG